MNRGQVTGGIVREPAVAFVPGTGAKKVVFTIATRDRLGRESFWACEADDPAVMQHLEAEGRRGVGILVDFELTSRPYVERGVHKGDVRFLYVTHAEIQTRQPTEASHT